MTDTRKSELEIGVNAGPAEQGFQKIVSAANTAGAAISQAGEKAGKGVDSIGKGADENAAKVERAFKNIARSIQTLTAEERSLSESGSRRGNAFFEERAKQFGVSAEAIKPYLVELEKARAANAKFEDSVQKTGKSARELEFALRGVPAQFTDIFTSLASGQRPLQVLMQQGGQLKDMFGGVGAAARALGGYVLGLVTPYTVAAAAVIGLVAAYEKGASEAREFSKALILSGNAAGTTSAQLAGYAANISKVVGTQSAAAEALAEFARSGKVGAENLEQFARAAISFERATGTAVSKTVEQFAELGKSPLEASAKLNDQMNYLTADIYRQIKALEDQGRATDAANLAQKAFADTLEGRSKQIIENLGFIERAWVGIKDAVKGAGSAIAGIGRAGTGAQELESLRTDLATREARGPLNPQAADAFEAGNKRIRERIALLERLGGVQAESAKNEAENARLQRLGIEFTKQGDAFLNKAQQMRKELTRAEVEGRQLVNAGIIKETELTQRLAGIREKYKETGTVNDGINAQVEALKRQALVLDEVAKREIARLKVRRELGEIAEQDVVAGAAAKEIEILDRQTAALSAQMKLLKAKKDSLKEQESIQGQIDLNAQKRISIERALADELDLIAKRRADTNNKAQYADSVQFAEDLAKAATIEYDARLKIRLGLDDYAQSLSEANELGQLELRMMGATSEARSVAIEKLKIEIDLRRRLRDIDGPNSGFENESQREEARARARELAAKAGAQAETRVYLDEWKKASESINNSLTDALLRGFESGKGFAENFRDTIVNMFKTMVLKPVIQAVLNPVSQGIAGVLSAGGAAAGQAGGGAGGILNAASAAASIFGAGGIGGSVAAGAGWLTGATTFGGALSAGASLVGTGTAAGIASGLGVMAGALGPIALGVAALVALSKEGETRQGAGYQVNNGIAQFGGGPSGGAINKDVETKLVQDTYDSINSILKQLGSSATVSAFQAGLEASKNGKGAVFAGGSLSTGQSFGRTYDQTDYNRTLTPEEAAKQFGAELNQALLLALKVAPDVQRSVQERLKNVDIDKLTESATDSLLAEITNIVAFEKALSGLPFKNLAGLTGDAAVGLFKAAGGFDSLNGALANYYQNFYTEQERLDQNAKNLAKTFADLGLALPKDDAGFRAIFEGLDVQTKSGQEAAATLLSVSGAFKEMTAAASAQKAVTERLEISLLRAQGNEVEAVARERKKELEGLTDTQRAIQERINALSDEAKAREVQTKTGALQAQLLRIQGDETGALAIERAHELEALTGTQRAIQERINALTDEAKAREVQTRTDALQAQLLRAQGDETGALAIERIHELEALTESQKAIQLRIYALRDEARLLGEQKDAASKELSDLVEKYGDVGAAMDEIVDPALKLADAWRKNKTEIEALQEALNLKKPLTALEQYAQDTGGRDTFKDAVGNIDQQILATRASKIDQTGVQAIQDRISELWKSLGGAINKGEVLAQIQKFEVDKVKLQGEIEKKALEERYEREYEAAKVAYDLAKEARDVQRETLKEQLNGFEKLRDLAGEMGDFVKNLRSGDLSPLNYTDQLAQSKGLFESTLTKALAGDQKAIGDVKGNATNYLEEARKYFASSSAYGDIFASVTASLEALGSTGPSAAEASIAILKAQVSSLESLDKTTVPELKKAVVDTSDREVEVLSNVRAAVVDGQNLYQQAVDKQTAVLSSQLAEQIELRKQQELEIAKQDQRADQLNEKIEKLTRALEELSGATSHAATQIAGG